MVLVVIKCQRDEQSWKRGWWNVVNPASEKPKFGRGTFIDNKNEIKESNLDKYLPHFLSVQNMAY